MRTHPAHRYLPAVLCLGLCLVGPVSPAQEEPPEEVDPNPSFPMGRHRLDVSIGAGAVTYEEKVTIDPIDSDWTSDYLRLGAAWRYQDPRRMLFRVQGSYWVSSEDSETWRSGGTVLQENRLKASGVELRGEIGHGLVRKEGLDLNGWLGLGARGQDFERDSFRLFGEEPTFVPSTVSETYALSYVSAGFDGWFNITGAWRGGVGLTAGWIFMNQADNDLVGSVDGRGGYILEGRVSAEWRLHPRHALVIGAFFDEQALDGDTVSAATFEDGVPVTSVVEWPDNTTRLLGIEARWLYLL